MCKVIRLKKLILENFMMYAQAEFNFSELTKIMGKNGKGKSSIVNAYTWLLFNCDYELNDNPVVRRTVDGKSVDDMDTAVTAVLDIDGKEVTAKKVQKRTYDKAVKDGIVVETVSDNNSYYINSVFKTLKAFNEYFDVNMKLFKMCSNSNAFINQKPTEMREFLFQFVSKISDIDFASINSELHELVPLLEKYKADEIRVMNQKVKSDYNTNSKILDGQIKEKVRDIQIKSDIDTAELVLQKNALKEQLEQNLYKQNGNENLLAEYDKATQDIMQLQMKLSEMQNMANSELESQRAELRATMMNKSVEINSLKSSIRLEENEISNSNKKITELTEEKTRLRNAWKTVNAEKFDSNTAICPTCHRELPEEDVKNLMETFEKSKTDRIGKIETDGFKVKGEIEKEQQLLKDKEQLLSDLNENLNTANKEYAEMTAKLESIPQYVDIRDREDYKSVQAEIVRKEELLKQSTSLSDIKKSLKLEESEIRAQLAEVEKKIASTNTESDETRLEELRNQKTDLEQAKTDAAKILALLDQLDRAKNEALTDAVNSHFSLVKWQLFDTAKNGNYKSVCIPTVEGKSILTTMSNKGNRILGRVDICNSIQKMCGICTPVFLDDSESLDDYNQLKVAEMVDSQLIMLIVNENEKLEVV